MQTCRNRREFTYIFPAFMLSISSNIASLRRKQFFVEKISSFFPSLNCKNRLHAIWRNKKDPKNNFTFLCVCWGFFLSLFLKWCSFSYFPCLHTAGWWCKGKRSNKSKWSFNCFNLLLPHTHTTHQSSNSTGVTSSWAIDMSCKSQENAAQSHK